MLAPLQVCPPVPALVTLTTPVPFWMMPEKVPPLLLLPTVSVAAVALVLVTVPPPLNWPMALPDETPFKSSVAPVRIFVVTLAPLSRPVPESCTVPSLMFVAPVWALAALSTSVPVPFFVRPPVVPLVRTLAIVS